MVVRARSGPEEPGAELCVRFANTVEWRLREQPNDRLLSFDWLLRFGVRTGMLDERREEELREAAAAHPTEAAAAFSQAIALREAIYKLLAAVASGAPLQPEDVAALNRSISEAHSRLTLYDAGEADEPSDRLSWGWELRDDAEAFGLIEWEVARSAAALLSSDGLHRLKACPGDGCGWLFVDTSRNGTRRWCEMDVCGNRNKVRRHRQRNAERAATAR